MKLMIENRIIPALALILGLSFCTSTSIMSGAYIALAFFSLFTINLRQNLNDSLKNKYVLGLVIFYILFLIGSFWSIAPLGDISLRLLRIIGYGLSPLFFVALNKNKSAKLLLTGFIGGAFISAIASIITFLFNHPLRMGPRDGMSLWVVFHGHLIHDVFLAIASCLVLRIIIDKIYSSRTRLLCLFIYLIFIIDCLVIVTGRTGQLMLLTTNVMVFILYFRWRGLFASLLGVMILVPLLLTYSPSVKTGFEAYKHDQAQLAKGDTNTSSGLRYEFHQNSQHLIQQKPLYGYGTGSFKKVYSHYATLKGNRVSDNPHNDWLLVGVETGLIGIIVFGLLFILNICSTLKLNKFAKHCSIAILIGYFVGVTQNSFFMDNVTGLAYIFITLALLIYGKSK